MNKLRLQRRGRTFSPHYRFIATPSRSPQSSLSKAVLGIYHPIQGSSAAFYLGAISKYIKLGSKCSSNGLRVLLKQLKHKTQD